MSGDGRRTKVERVIEEYDLSGWGERLESAWLGERGERESLRDLADELNRAVLETALEDAGRTPIEADVRSTYRTITDDDVPRTDRLRKRRDLERDGIDVEGLLGDFVTHQAVHTYLTRVRDAELSERSTDPVERRRETVQRLAGRTRAVTDSSLEELVDAGELDGGPYEALVNVNVVCGNCGGDFTVEELLAQGGCRCPDETVGSS